MFVGIIAMNIYEVPDKDGKERSIWDSKFLTNKEGDPNLLGWVLGIALIGFLVWGFSQIMPRGLDTRDPLDAPVTGYARTVDRA